MSIDEIPQKLDSLFDKSGIKLFYRISNYNENIWYIPDEGCRRALSIYQPSSICGKLFKVIFPLIKRASFFRRVLKISIHKFDLQASLNVLLCRILKCNNVIVAIYCGTPSVHQKIVLQVASESKIIGYCKLSRKEEDKHLLRHEEEILEHLNRLGLRGIPKCSFLVQKESGINILIQSTLKSSRSKTIHKLTTKHWEFLQRLTFKTMKILPYENSDFHSCLKLLKTNLDFLSIYDIDILISTIYEVELKYTGLKVEFSMCHADFTPWNMVLEKGELFVYDWEYAFPTCPPFLDAYHFFTQTHTLVNHSDATQIFKSYIANRNIFSEFINEPDFIYKNYLLFILSFYAIRDKGEFKTDVSKNIKIWLALLKLLQKNEDN